VLRKPKTALGRSELIEGGKSKGKIAPEEF
jgi:hypothetical protein